MKLTKEEVKDLRRVYFSNGVNSVFYLDSSKKRLLKRFKKDDYCDHKSENIEYLLFFPIIKNSGYPVEAFIIDDEVVGYVCNFYEGSKCFNDGNSFSFLQRHQAIQDCCLQLKTLHGCGAIFNDMNSHNQLIDASGGHLVDFENVFIKEKFEVIPSKSYFLHSSKHVVKSSKKSDQIKQYIISLGLLYQLDLEILFSKGALDAEQLNFLFDFNEDISSFLKRQLPYLLDPDVDVFDYFDSLLPKLMDEEKIEYEKGKLKQKQMIKRIPDLV